MQTNHSSRSSVNHGFYVVQPTNEEIKKLYREYGVELSDELLERYRNGHGIFAMATPPPPKVRPAGNSEPRDEDDPRNHGRTPNYWRQLESLASTAAKSRIPSEKVLADLREKLPEAPTELPPLDNAAAACVNLPDLPPEIIAGVLHQGSKMSINGGSKSFKTWTLIELAVCVAEGLDWLGRFPTTQARVLYINFELAREFALRRIDTVSCALGLETAPQGLEIWNLRGYSADAAVILPKIAGFAADKEFGLVVIDPIYKLLGRRDENLARDMADLMREIELLAIKTNAAAVFAAHFAKGNAALKEAIDRASGSGVTARDPDSIVTMTRHKEDDCFSVELILRNLPPQKSFVVRREHPLMKTDELLDPADLKQPKRSGGRDTEYDDEELFEFLGPSMKTAEWAKTTCDETGMASSTFYRLKKQLLAKRKISKSALDGTWIDKRK